MTFCTTSNQNISIVLIWLSWKVFFGQRNNFGLLEVNSSSRYVLELFKDIYYGSKLCFIFRCVQLFVEENRLVVGVSISYIGVAFDRFQKSYLGFAQKGILGVIGNF